MKLISNGQWQAQPSVTNIKVDAKTCIMTFTTTTFSAYGANPQTLLLSPVLFICAFRFT
jgi:hypothetical protein